MKNIIMTALVLLLAASLRAQITGVSLKAGGLTCSMCSKAVWNALQKVPFVAKVDVDIKSQQYNIVFKDTAAIDLDALQKAVQDAGFSVVALSVTAQVHDLAAQKDQHLLISHQYFHFLNATGQQLDGTIHFTVVDRTFTSARNYKKYSSLSSMSCVQTGKIAACCAKKGLAGQTRIYHAII